MLKYLFWGLHIQRDKTIGIGHSFSHVSHKKLLFQCFAQCYGNFVDIDSILLQIFRFKSQFKLDKSKGYAVSISLCGVESVCLNATSFQVDVTIQMLVIELIRLIFKGPIRHKLGHL